MDRGKIMKFKVCGVSVRGRSHEIENSPCRTVSFIKAMVTRVL